MLLAAVIAFCVLLLILAFIAPRLSRGPQHAADKAAGAGQRGASHAPGRLGRWLAKPFGTSRKAFDKSAAAGRRGRGKLPL
jgi:hypothetical protein